MKKDTLNLRLCLFLLITMLMSWGYQVRENKLIDRDVAVAMEGHNRSVVRYSQMLDRSRIENEGLKHDLLHWQAMYEASKGHCQMLEEEIGIVDDHWKKRYLKVSDELFNVRHGK
tara:strand:- start:890 stop:1234 length:345 start_codon:yes stop_codon:yes gene_type:complete